MYVVFITNLNEDEHRVFREASGMLDWVEQCCRIQAGEAYGVDLISGSEPTMPPNPACICCSFMVHPIIVWASCLAYALRPRLGSLRLSLG